MAPGGRGGPRRWASKILNLLKVKKPSYPAEG